LSDEDIDIVGAADEKSEELEPDIVEAGGAPVEEDEAAEPDALTSTIEKTWALAYEAKVRPSASDNMMKESLVDDSSGDQEEGLENRKDCDPRKR
jgi:hypothetical protein